MALPGGTQGRRPPAGPGECSDLGHTPALCHPGGCWWSPEEPASPGGLQGWGVWKACWPAWLRTCHPHLSPHHPDRGAPCPEVQAGTAARQGFQAVLVDPDLDRRWDLAHGWLGDDTHASVIDECPLSPKDHTGLWGYRDESLRPCLQVPEFADGPAAGSPSPLHCWLFEFSGIPVNPVVFQYCQ